MKKRIKNYVELNNFYKFLCGKDLSTYQLLLIYLLTKSATADRHKIDNSLPPNFLSNALLWSEIVSVAIGYYNYQINSGYRCPQVNQKVRGVNNSKHLSALAVDFGVHNHTTNVEISEFIRFIDDNLENTAFVDYYYRRGNMLHVQLKLK